MSMTLRLGDILVKRGLLSEQQRQHVLDVQAKSGEPFGVLCERLFQIDPDAVEDAWSMQYIGLTRHIDPRHEVFEDRALDLVSRRQAWQFGLLPIRFDGQELMIATTERQLRRALRFATRFIGVPAYFVISEPGAFSEALCRRFPLAGMSAGDDGALERLLSMARTG